MNRYELMNVSKIKEFLKSVLELVIYLFVVVVIRWISKLNKFILLFWRQIRLQSGG